MSLRVYPIISCIASAKIKYLVKSPALAKKLAAKILDADEQYMKGQGYRFLLRKINSMVLSDNAGQFIHHISGFKSCKKLDDPSIKYLKYWS